MSKLSETSKRPDECGDRFDDAPIGIFDSGYGGLTVVREICEHLPQENIVFVGDSARCPYGPRDLAEVDRFVQQICKLLISRHVKMIVVGCNTATAAGLAHAQRSFSVPIIGVVEPGARTAVRMTVNRKVGVIATQGTVDSHVYSDAISHLDVGISVFSAAAPRFVEIAEMGVKLFDGVIQEDEGDLPSNVSSVYVRPEFEEVAREYLEPLKDHDIDTLVMGCTHYPLLKDLIGHVMGDEVALVSSAAETAREVAETLSLRCALAHLGNEAYREFLTTGDDVDEFKRFGERVLSHPMDHTAHVDLESEVGTL